MEVRNSNVLNLRNMTSCSLVLIYRCYQGTPCLMNLRQDRALPSSEMSIYCYQTAQRHIPADGGVHLPVNLLSVCPSFLGPRSDSFVPPRPCHDPEGFPEGPQGTGTQPQDNAAADRHRCAVRHQLASSRSVVLTDTNAGRCQITSRLEEFRVLVLLRAWLLQRQGKLFYVLISRCYGHQHSSSCLN